jgi:hypothetical protein
MLMCVCACVRARACARYPRALCAMRHAGQPVSSLLIITVLTTWRCQFHFSQVYSHRLPSLLMCVCVRACVRARVRAIRVRVACALSARVMRYAGQPVSSLLIITVLTTRRCQFHFSQVYSHRLPSLLMCVCVRACVRARVRAICARVRAIRARSALCRTTSPFLAHYHCFDDLALSISLFQSLLTQAPITAYVCVCACVRARARYALCAMQDSQSLPCSSSLF